MIPGLQQPTKEEQDAINKQVEFERRKGLTYQLAEYMRRKNDQAKPTQFYFGEAEVYMSESKFDLEKAKMEYDEDCAFEKNQMALKKRRK